MPDIFVSERNKEKETKSPEEPRQEFSEKKADQSTQDEGSKSPKQKVGLFTNFAENPGGIIFSNLDDNEKILLFLRRHFITNASWVLKAIIAFVLPFIVLSLLGFVDFDPIPSQYLFIFSTFYFLVLSGYLFVHFLSWLYNVTLITDQRVVDIDFSNLVVESGGATKLSQIEDVSYEQVGVLSSLFDYGNVTVQTAGAASNFLFAGVPHPEKVVHLINNLIGKQKHV